MRQVLVILLLWLSRTKPALTVNTETDQFCKLVAPQLKEECGVYAQRVVQPMFAYFEQLKQKIDQYDSRMESKAKQISKLEANVTQLRVEIASCTAKNEIIELLKDKHKSNVELIEFLKQQIESLTKLMEIKKSNSSTDSSMAAVVTELGKLNEQIKQLNVNANCDNEKERYKTQLKTRQDTIALRDEQILQLETELAKQKELSELRKKKAKSCLDVDSTGVYNISLRNDYRLEILCNFDIAGPGWTIIQQRIKGEVDFYRNWTEYVNGFGSFWAGDFFVGLENIHRLTNDQPHELYIYLKEFNGSTLFARYDEFIISGVEDQYRLSKVAGFTGNTTDQFSSHQNMTFATYDHGNGIYININCAVILHSGWWHNFLGSSNLNGKYVETEEPSLVRIYWNYHGAALKEVRLMIRPKAV